MKQLLPERRYFRFQVRLDEGSDDLDNTSKTNLRVLSLLAEGLIDQEKTQLGQLVNELG
jgi:hypothetical protein